MLAKHYYVLNEICGPARQAFPIIQGRSEHYNWFFNFFRLTLSITTERFLSLKWKDLCSEDFEIFKNFTF